MSACGASARSGARRSAIAGAAFATLLVLLVVATFARAHADDPPPYVEITVTTGRTLLEPGRPVANARAAFAVDGQVLSDVAANSVAADAAGVLRLTVPAGGGTALVFADGMAPAALRIDMGFPRTVTLSAGHGIAVQLQASDGTGVGAARVTAEVRVPVAGAVVGAAAWHLVRYTAVSGQGGRAQLSGLPGDPLSVSAQAPGFVTATAFPVDPKSESVALFMSRGARVSGTLRLIPSGEAVAPLEDAKPAAGIAVAVLGDLRAPVAVDGTFAFEVVPAGPARLTFDGRGFAPPQPRELLIAEGRNRTDLIVEAVRTGSLTAMLVAPDGLTPPATADVDVTWPPSANRDVARQRVSLDADGVFRLDNLDAADGVSIDVRAPGFVAARANGISIPAGGESLAVRIALVGGGIVDGALHGDDGAPLPGVTVGARASGAAEGTPDVARTESDAEGRFHLDGVPAGEFVLRVLPPGLAAASRFGAWRIAPRETLDVGVLQVIGGHALRGRVLLVSDRPAATAATPPAIVVRAVREGRTMVSTPVSADLSFELRNLAAGAWELQAVDDGEIVGREQTTLPSAWGVTIAIASPREIAGRLVDEAGRTIYQATVTAERVRAGSRANSAAESAAVWGADGVKTVSVRDGLGQFFVRLPVGRWRLSAVDGLRRTGAAEVDIPSGASPYDVTLVMRPGTDVRGSAFEGETGLPLEGATVRAITLGEAPQTVAEDRVDDRGAFLLHGVPAGVVRIRVDSAQYPSFVTDPILIRTADAPDIGRIEVPRGVRVEGTVYGIGREVLADVTVSIESENGTLRVATTDVFGRYVLDHVEGGPARIRTSGEEAASGREVRVYVPRNKLEWQYDIDVSHGTRLTGRVSTGGRPEAFATVRASCGGGVVSAVADAFGRYALPPLPRGEASVEVTPSDGGAPWLTTVTVDGSAELGVELAMPEGSVEGRVISSDGSRPVGGAVLILRRPGGIDTVAETRSRGDGTYSLRRVPAGDYVMTATSEGFGSWLSDAVHVPQAGAVYDLSVELPPDCAVVFRVVDRDLRPVAGGWVEARPRPARGDRVALRAYSDATGRVSLPGMRRGAWALSAGAPGFGRLELGVVAIDEGSQDLGDAVLDVEGVLVVEAFHPVLGFLPRIAVELKDAYDGDPRPLRRPDDPLRGGDPIYVTDAFGQLRIAGLATGTYRVRALGAPDDAEIRVSIRPGRVVRILLPVPDPRASRR